MKFAKLIKKYRDEADLSQQAFADKIQVSKTTVSNWETGKTQLEITNTEIIDSICETLSIMKSELLSSLVGSDKEESLEIHDFFKKHLPKELLKAELSEPLVKIFVVSMQIGDFDFKKLSEYYNITENPIILCSQIRQLHETLNVFVYYIQWFNSKLKNDRVGPNEKAILKAIFDYIIDNQCDTFNIRNLIDMLGEEYLVDCFIQDRLGFLNNYYIENFHKGWLERIYPNGEKLKIDKETLELILNKKIYIHNIYHVSGDTGEEYLSYEKHEIVDEESTDESFINIIHLMTFDEFPPKIENNAKCNSRLDYETFDHKTLKPVTLKAFPVKLSDLEENDFIKITNISIYDLCWYEKQMNLYGEEFSKYMEKRNKVCERLRGDELQKQKHLDAIEEPIAPAKPDGETEYIPNKKLRAFIEDCLHIMSDLEAKTTERQETQNKRLLSDYENNENKLKPYLGSKIKFNGIYSGRFGTAKDFDCCNYFGDNDYRNVILFNDIYIEGEYLCDKLDVFGLFDVHKAKNFENFIPGERYCFEAKVIEDVPRGHGYKKIGISNAKLII